MTTGAIYGNFKNRDELFICAFGEQWLRAVTKEEDLPMPADQLVRVLHAMIERQVFQRLLTPELVPDEIFRAAFVALR